MIFLLIVVLISLYFYYQMFGKRRHLPPGPTPWPIVGNLFQMDIKNPDKTIAEWGKQYGSVYSIFFPKPCVVITDFDVMKESILKQGDAYAGRPDSFIFSIFTAGKFGIVLSDGPFWREQRRFALHVLRDFGFGRNIMETKVMLEVDRLVEHLSSINNRGETFDPQDVLSVCVGSIISRLLFGHPYDFDDQRFYDLKRLLSRNFQLFSHPAAQMLDLYPWLRYVPLFGHFKYDEFIIQDTEFRKFAFAEIDEHKLNFDENVEPEDYIDSFLKEMKRRETTGEPMGSFSEWQLYCALADLWIAGMETTVTTLRWGLVFMLRNPEIQEKVHQEIDHEIGKDAILTMNDKNRLPYVSATINEIQRRANIVPVNLLHETTENVILGGYQIPAGTTIAPQISAVLQDAQLFPDPEKFKPERFLEDDGKAVKKDDHLVPFSMGKRQCLGESLAKMELFLVFATLMQKFKFTTPVGGQKPSLERVQGLTVSPTSYECRAEAR